MGGHVARTPRSAGERYLVAGVNGSFHLEHPPSKPGQAARTQAASATAEVGATRLQSHAEGFVALVRAAANRAAANRTAAPGGGLPDSTISPTVVVQSADGHSAEGRREPARRVSPVETPRVEAVKIKQFALRWSLSERK